MCPGLRELRKKVQVEGGGEMREPAESEAYIHSSSFLTPTPTPPPPPNPSPVPIHGGKVHYMLANQTTIPSFRGMEQEWVFLIFLLLRLPSVRLLHLPAAPLKHHNRVQLAADV